MDIAITPAEPEFIGRIDFSAVDFGVRTNQIEARAIRLERLDWTVFLFFSPLGTAFHLFRVYSALSKALHHHFEEERRRKSARDFESQLSELSLSASSEHAYHCFGMFPKLFGGRFGAGAGSSLVAQRLLSVAVPGRAAQACMNHFQAQIAEFGQDSLTCAPEGMTLALSRSASESSDGRLLLGMFTKMSSSERAEVEVRLANLINSAAELERFNASVDPAIKVGGAVRCPDDRDLVSGSESECIRIGRLRLQLVSSLRWPHALQRVAEEARHKSPSALSAETIRLTHEALASYISPHENPMSE